VANTTIDFTRAPARVPDSRAGVRRWRGAPVWLLVLGCTTGSACSGLEPDGRPVEEATPLTEQALEPERQQAMTPSHNVPQAMLDAALDDAARRASVDRASITVVTATAVTWADGSVGCPEPGVMYTQALVPGYRIVLQAGDRVFNYHAGRGGVPMFCPAERVVPPSAAGDAVS
jgi:hypothetical protein